MKRNTYRELNEELLLDSWRLLRKDAALGVDRVSAAEYEANLGENIKQLVERLKRKLAWSEGDQVYLSKIIV